MWRVSLGIGKLSAEMLLVHGALTRIIASMEAAVTMAKRNAIR